MVIIGNSKKNLKIVTLGKNDPNVTIFYKISYE